MPVRAEPRLEPSARAWPIKWDAIVELIERGWLTLDDLVDMPEPRWRTPTPADVEVPGAVFSVELVDRKLRALAGLRHTKGRWARTPFRPAPWQVIYLLAPAFGWLAPSAEGALVRIIRVVWLEVPRKNGKSTVASGIAILLLVADGEAGAEVYAAATSKDQAGVVFREAVAMLRTVRRLRGKFKPLAELVRVPRSNSFFRVLSKAADAAHGLNVSGAVVDEIHVHRSRDLIDAIATGTGARDQPLVVYLTTADDGTEGSIYAELHDDVIALAEGTAELDPSTYGVIFAADEDDDPLAPATWAKANPGLGITVALDYIEREAKRAERMPSYLPVFERLHLNRRTAAFGRWLPIDRWDACGGILDEHELRGSSCYAGLDIGSTDDLTAWLLLFPAEVRPLELDEWGRPTDNRLDPIPGYRVVPRIWIPEASIARRERMAPKLRQWVKAGYLRQTPGDAVDHAIIERDIELDAEAFSITEFAFDPWQAEGLRQRLMDGGLDGVKCSQKLATLAAPSKELERLVLARALEHGGNPAMRWMVANAVAFRDGDGNVKPDKRRSSDKIDAVSALVMALHCAIRPRVEEGGHTGFAMVIGGDE